MGEKSVIQTIRLSPAMKKALGQINPNISSAIRRCVVFYIRNHKKIQ